MTTTRDLTRIGGKLARARERVAGVTAEARAAAADAVAGGLTETAVAGALGVDRMTVRKWVGKR